MLDHCGTFVALLQLLVKYDDDLKNHLQYRKKNALYVSNTIQNEIITIIGDIIREKVSLAILNDSVLFSIIGDEVTETHYNKEILSIYLRFVPWNAEKLPPQPLITLISHI